MRSCVCIPSKRSVSRDFHCRSYLIVSDSHIPSPTLPRMSPGMPIAPLLSLQLLLLLLLSPAPIPWVQQVRGVAGKQVSCTTDADCTRMLSSEVTVCRDGSCHCAPLYSESVGLEESDRLICTSVIAAYVCLSIGLTSIVATLVFLFAFLRRRRERLIAAAAASPDTVMSSF